MTKATLTDKQRELAWKKLLLAKEIKIRKARTSFWDYCQVINPDFFKDDRWYLKKVADSMQGIYEGTLINEETGKPYKNMSLNLPPGHGKSYTATLFSQWLLGTELTNQVITVSYNETMSSEFSKGVRDGIATGKGEGLDITFSDVFPTRNIKRGDASVQKWSLEGHYMNYLATSFNGTVTGMRGNVAIIDDPVKNADEAFNDHILEQKFTWYNDTFLSRVLKGGIKIVIATRWSTKDLTGRLMDREPEDWYELRLPACLNEETGEMLCDDIFDFDMYQSQKRFMSEEIFMANYQQEPMDVKGRLYTELHTHEEYPIPRDTEGNPLFEKIISYTDTADKGADNFVSIVGGVYKGQIWVLDVLYTKDPMEKTEIDQANILMKWKVNEAVIESNSGGSYFASKVEERMQAEGYRYTQVKRFHQSKNKEARILVNSSYVMNNIFFPNDWRNSHSRFYQDLMSYQREGKNKHDDAPDALTGLAEMVHTAVPELRAVPRLY